MNKKPLITITTDFKDGFATSQLKAVVYSLGYEGNIVENHDVSDYSIVEGAYGIWQLIKSCPPGTVHVGVIDPGVGSERAGIVIRTKNFWFVGPDNGLLWPAAKTDGIEKIWRIDETRFDKVTKTFHGRDVFIKQAVYLAQGELPRGENISNIIKLEFEDGQILHVDAYGNAKIWGKNTFGLPLVTTFSEVPVGTPLVLNGSSDLLELAVNQDSAKERYKLQLGEVITELEVKYEDMVNDKRTLIKLVEENRAEFRKFGVDRVGLFGSFMRDEQTPESDVDLLVDFIPGQKTYRNLLKTADLAESLVGRKVEVVTPQSVSKYILPYIQNEVYYVQTT